MKRLLAVCALAALSAACGGSSAAPTSSASLTSLEAKGALTGCTTSTQPLTVAVATCTYGQGSVTLATFASDKSRDLWLLAAKSSLGGNAIVGPSWTAVTLDPADAATLAGAMGGKVQ